MKNKKYINSLIEKSNNSNSIRILYKKVGQVPEVKIINDLRRLKKSIIDKKLEIIAYQNVFIICHNKKQRKYMPINIILDFYNISGDLIIVEIDSNKREFVSLSQENIIWFTNVLNSKTPITKKTKNNSCSKEISKYFLPNMKELGTNENNNVENKLIQVLSHIELLLTCLIADNKKRRNKK